MKPLEKPRLRLEFIQERKAIDPILMEVGRLTSFTHYFRVASGNSSRQAHALSTPAYAAAFVRDAST